MPNLHKDDERAQVLATLSEEQTKAVEIETAKRVREELEAIKRDGDKLGEFISSAVNNFSRQPIQTAAKKLAKDHRTLQQGTMRFCVWFIEAMAENGTDGRNESAVRFAKQVMERIDPNDRIMPFI